MRRLVGVVVVAAIAAGGCSRIQHHFFGHSTVTRKGTITIAPPSGPAGTAFTITAGAFRPGEHLTFEIDVPGHPRFVGPSHTAGPDGSVGSSYTPQAGDPPGTYGIKAVGDRGTQATATLQVTG